MTVSRWSWCTVVFLLFVGILPTLAQESAGRIRGRVVKDGKGVGGVAILLVELRLTEITDAKGAFTFEKIPAGGYTLIATRAGNSTTRPEVFVLSGQTREVDLAVDWEIGVSETVTVTAAAQRAAKIVDAPAAITSVAEEQIEQEAAHGQLPKVLEFTPGVEITQGGLYDFNFNTRGFNSSLNRRVSSYIDGRDVSVVLLGAQEWAALVPLDDLASLEFIRGPSAALYGANASSGVINMTTKAPRDSLGRSVRLTYGELATVNVDFREAREIKNGWYYKVVAGTRDSGDFTLSRDDDVVSRPEYSVFCERVGEIDCLQKEKDLFFERNHIALASVRFDKYLSDDSLLTFEAGTADIEGPTFQTGIGRVTAISVRRPYARFNYSAPHWNVQGHYAERRGHQANLTRNLRVGFDLYSDTKRYGVEAQGNWNFGGDRGRFVIGAAYTEERVNSEDPGTGRQTIVYDPISSNREAVFSQLDWRASEHFKLVFAGRIDRSSLHDTQFSPKAAVVYNITPSHTLRFTFNKAFQVANYSEFFLHARLTEYPLDALARVVCGSFALPPELRTDCGITEAAPIYAVGNNSLRLEKTKAFEVGYSAILARKAFLTVDYYNSENTDFITDLIPQVGTSLGERTNPDYADWVGPPATEDGTIELCDPFEPSSCVNVAQALRDSVATVLGPAPFGFQLAQDLDGSTAIIGRTYANVGKVKTQGVDLALQYFISNAWNLQASYSWFDFEIVDATADIEEILLPNTPTHKASMGVAFNRKRVRASLNGRWVDDFRWSAGICQGDVPAYSTVDLAASFAFNRNLRLGVNVANLRDTVHYESFCGDLLTRRALTNISYQW